MSGIGLSSDRFESEVEAKVEAEPSSNWVKRRVHRERILGMGAANVWEALGAAILDASASFNEHYGNDSNGRQEVICQVETGMRILVSKKRVSTPHWLPEQEVTSTIVIHFDSKRPSITYVGHNVEASGEFKISSDDKRAHLVDGDRETSPDEASRRILEPLFFPDE
jgi:hypothetical protein